MNSKKRIEQLEAVIVPEQKTKIEYQFAYDGVLEDGSSIDDHETYNGVGLISGIIVNVISSKAEK